MSLNIALAKGRIAKQAIRYMEDSGCLFREYNENNRKLVFSDDSQNVKIFLVKAPDVPVYVERGTADIGIVGKDTLLEENYDLFEIMSLNIGKCHMATAGLQDFVPDYSKKLTVATKYPNITKKYFSDLGKIVNIIKLNGSVELAPILGLSDIIVDIVETGNTLRENGLITYEKFLSISSRIVCNKISFKNKTDQINWFLNLMKTVGEEDNA